MTDYESLYDSFIEGKMVSFYTIMYPGLLAFATRMLGESLAFMAEDCVQDAVMSTYEHRGEFDDAVHWRWYLMRCIRHKALNLLRHKGVTDVYASSFGDGPAAERDISYALIRQETLDTLFAAIDRLPPQYRQIFELKFEQGLKNHEIARILDVAEITVKKRKTRMLELLRLWLGPEADTIILVYLMTLKGVG